LQPDVLDVFGLEQREGRVKVLLDFFFQVGFFRVIFLLLALWGLLITLQKPNI
jgi:hypothetical protein